MGGRGGGFILLCFSFSLSSILRAGGIGHAAQGTTHFCRFLGADGDISLDSIPISWASEISSLG